MGTKVDCKSCLPGYFSMRDLNEDSSSSSWPLYCGDKTAISGQYFSGFIPRSTIAYYSGCDKSTLKQKILEHETVFRNQVYELHRLYRIQRDMMEEVKRKIFYEQGLVEPSSSSNFLGCQKPTEDSRKLDVTGFPVSSSGFAIGTILGVETVNSLMSSTKDHDTWQGQFPLHNGPSSNVCEPSESRPFKVRKLLFDLQVADEYANTKEGENLPEQKASDMSGYSPNENQKTAPSSMKLFLGNSADVKVDCQIDASVSSSCFRSSVVLTDLNEPPKIEELTAPSSSNDHGHTYANGKEKRINQHAKSDAKYFGAVHDGFSVNLSTESKVNGRGWLSYVSEVDKEYDKNILDSLSHCAQQDKFHMHSHPVQGMIRQVNPSSGRYPAVCCWGDLQKDSSYHGIIFSDRNHMHPHENHPTVPREWNPLRSSAEHGDYQQNACSYPLSNSPCFMSSWSQSVSSREKSKNGFTKPITSFGSPFISATKTNGRSLPSEPFERKWHATANARLNPRFRSEGAMVDGFCYGYASGSKKPQVNRPSVATEYLNCNRRDVVPHHSTNKVIRILEKGSCNADFKSAIDINLNKVSSSLNEPLIMQNLNGIAGKTKPEDQLSAIPWPKHVELGSSYLQASSTQFSCYRETVQDLNQPFTPEVMLVSSNDQVIVKKEIVEVPSFKKILGVPTYESVEPKKEPSALVFSSSILDHPPEKRHFIDKRENMIIDINQDCETDEQMLDEEMAVKIQTKASCYIDLNSCASDCEDTSAPSLESKSGKLNMDLEAPASIASDGDYMPFKVNKMEQIQDEALRNAADIIVSISSSCLQIHLEESAFDTSEASLADTLLLFINAESSCAVEHVFKTFENSRAADRFQQVFYEMDEFEAMTLQLADAKVEDFQYMPSIPEVQIDDDEGINSLTTRSRRRQSRRGRQRKDFQRDILPGLTSLSRHEVTEDLQIFGGMMRATGHHWNSGLTRRNGTRNGGARGRRRTVVEPAITMVPSTYCTSVMKMTKNIEACLEDRSLTGWGKTTRRPRRQRCPAGNPLTVIST